jgi:spore germination protein GerM
VVIVLKNSFFRRFAVSSLLLLLSFVLYNFPEEMKVSEEDKMDKHRSFLVDDNEYVSLVELNCNVSHDEVLGTFELLISTECFPYGFSSYLPSSTKLLDYSIDVDLLKLNFSKDILSVKVGYEEKMLEMIIYSFTNIDGIDKVMLFVEGELLHMMPNSNKVLDSVLDRRFGINKVYDIQTLNDNISFNVYYLGKSNDYYYVPVTYVVSESDDVVEMIIKRLKSNTISSSLLTHINSNVEMISYELDDEKIEVLLENVMYDGYLNETIEYALVSSFKDTFNIEKVDILFNS